MQNDKAAGPSGVVTDTLKVSGEAGTEWVTDVCNAVVRERRTQEDTRVGWSAYIRVMGMP